MSSFIVTNQTISNILSLFFWKRRKYCFEYQIENELNLKEEKDFKEFGKQLLKLNIEATNQRYPNNPYLTSKEAKKRIASFKWSDNLKNDMQGLKSLHCFLYQCSEGNIPETELYKTLKTISHRIKDAIIAEIPAYNKAEWG